MTKTPVNNKSEKAALRATRIYFITKQGLGPLFFEYGQPDFGLKLEAFGKWSTGVLWVLARTNDKAARLVPVELASNSVDSKSNIVTTYNRESLKRFGKKSPEVLSFIAEATFS